jgi:hypothetical protein
LRASRVLTPPTKKIISSGCFSANKHGSRAGGGAK